MDQIVPDLFPAAEDEIAALARRYRRANGPVMAIVTKLGGRFERQMEMLPPTFRDKAAQATEAALRQAWDLADRSGQRLPDPGRRVSLAAAMVTGAAGGAGGIATALAELPVTVTLILHAIRAEAVAAGLDVAEPDVAAECLKVFAAGSPLSDDDGIDTSFLSARLTLTGPALQGLIAAVAPKLAATLTQKLAAQVVPVLGAVSGAALNVAFLNYYREVAAVRFALLALGRIHGQTAVAESFRREAGRAPVIRT